MSHGFWALGETVGALIERPGAATGAPRAILSVRGPRALEALNGLLTNDLSPLSARRGVYAFALTPKGRPIADMRVLPAPLGDAADPDHGSHDPDHPDEHVWLDVPGVACQPLLEHLARFVPPFFARVERLDIGRASLIGPRWREAAATDPHSSGAGPPGTAIVPAAEADRLSEAGPLSVADADPTAAPGAVLVVRREPIEGDGIDLYAPRHLLPGLGARLVDAATACGGAEAAPEDWNTLRIELGLPLFGPDISGDNLPQETGQTTRAVSFSKGCYTGQEVVARIHYRGHVNRLLRGVRAVATADDGVLERGLELFDGARRVGVLTSAATSPRAGRIGIGYVRREIGPPARLSASSGGEPSLALVELPFTSE
jgi:folate-binding protein YgfZ